jgi:two-component system chemotaxis sensor kinase CheA
MSLDAALQTFLIESRDLLQQMEYDLLQLENDPQDPELLNALFRSVHTVKGASGIFGLEPVVNFTHVVESLLDKLRQQQVQLSSDLAALLLKCRDHILDLVELTPASSDELSPGQQAIGSQLLESLERYLPALSDVVAVNDPEPVEAFGGGPVDSDTWHISLRFNRDVLQHGMDPIAFIRYLGSLGELIHVETVADGLPKVAEYDPEACYLGFEIAFRGEVDKKTIEDVFEFVRDDCELRILPPRSQLGAFMRLIGELPEDDSRLGELLMACGALTRHELERGLALQAEQAEAPPRLGEALVGQGAVQAELVEAALHKQRQSQDNKAHASQYIRVQADKLDQLINLVGELVIASASTALTASASGDAATVESVTEIARLVEEIRDNSLQLRMVPIGETFQRFSRIVRDTAAELGKGIELVISGADTELDKTVVEKIADPLIHLVRNAVDHGIESAQTRLAYGKTAQGQVCLNAYHDSGSIVIEVVDDGGGLDGQAILAKAIERGLVRPEQELTAQEIFNLIFEPGFSTAAQVTNLSGRGVGMDVVRRSIEALRGTVDVESSLGAGSTFRIRLPLTLAIIDGFLVRAGSEDYVVPLEAVVECIELSGAQLAESREGNYINLRGEVLPFVRLREYFGIPGAGGRRENVIVVRYAGQKAGLLVDELLGEHQTVIKPMGSLFRHIKGISGSTILGNGRVALILDIPNLIQRLCQQEGDIRTVA